MTVNSGERGEGKRRRSVKSDNFTCCRKGRCFSAVFRARLPIYSLVEKTGDFGSFRMAFNQLFPNRKNSDGDAFLAPLRASATLFLRCEGCSSLFFCCFFRRFERVCVGVCKCFEAKLPLCLPQLKFFGAAQAARLQSDVRKAFCRRANSCNFS